MEATYDFYILLMCLVSTRKCIFKTINLNLNGYMWQVAPTLDSAFLEYNMSRIGPVGEFVLGGAMQPCDRRYHGDLELKLQMLKQRTGWIPNKTLYYFIILLWISLPHPQRLKNCQSCFMFSQILILHFANTC